MAHAVPVSQKPRKTRHKTPPKPTVQLSRRQSPIQRFLIVAGISVLVVSLALLTVTSYERKEQRAENQAEVVEKPTTTLLEPFGGVPCPDPAGTSARRDTFRRQARRHVSSSAAPTRRVSPPMSGPS